MHKHALIALIAITGCTAESPRPEREPSASTATSDVDRKPDLALAAGLLPALQPGETQKCSAIDNWALCCNGTAPPTPAPPPTPIVLTVGAEALTCDDVDAELKRTCCCACNQHGCDCDCGPLR